MNISDSTSVLPSLDILTAGSAPETDPASADRQAAAATGLPYTKTLLDSAALSELLGRKVIITHVRIKPGHSVVVSHRDAETTSGHAAGSRHTAKPSPDAAGASARSRRGRRRPASLPETGWGWTSVSDDADKFAKALRRAEQAEQPLTVHEDSSPYLASGSVWTDRVLAKELRAVWEQLGDQAQWEILRYNPRRRVVAAVTRPDQEGATLRHVVRVSACDLSGLLEAVGRWRRLGAPLTNMRAVGERGTATMTPLWGFGDLLSNPCPAAARTAGMVIAEVHSRGRELTEAPAHAEEDAPTPSPQRLAAAPPKETAGNVAQFAPWLAERANTLAETIQERLEAEDDETELHGDLSPDQVLIAAPQSHKIRIIDLDRTGRGPAMRDVGSWMAACRQSALPELSEAFLTGYATVAAMDRRAMHTWEAAAHLAAALDDFRHREPDWPAGVTRRIELAETAVRR